MANNTTLTTLEIDGIQKRNVLEYSYEFERPTDKENQPAGIPRGGRLYIKVDALTKSGNHLDLFSWMVNRTNKKNGKIIVREPADHNNILKTLTFGDAFCVKYKEVWKDVKDGKGETANTEEIYITWRTLTWDNVTYENEWVSMGNTNSELTRTVIKGGKNELSDMMSGL